MHISEGNVSQRGSWRAYLVAFAVGAVLSVVVALPTAVLLGPRISVSAEHVDFGAIYAGSKVSKTITISNAGRSTLLIKNVIPTCGCVQLQLEKASIPPGGTTHLVITLNEFKVASQRSQSVLLRTNSVTNPKFALSVVYSVVASTLITAPQFVDFGHVSRDSLPTTVRLYIFPPGTTRRGAKERRIDLRPADAFLRVHVAPSTQRDAFDSWVTLTRDVPSGVVSSFLDVGEAGAGVSRQVHVCGDVYGRYYADPPSLLMTTTNTTPESITILARDNATANFRVDVDEVSSTLSGPLTAVVAPSGTEVGVSYVVGSGPVKGLIGRRINGYIRFACTDATGYREVLNVPIVVIH